MPSATAADNVAGRQIFMSNISASFLWKFMIFLDWSDGFMGFGNAGALLDTIIRTEKNRNLNIIAAFPRIRTRENQIVFFGIVHDFRLSIL